MTSLTIGTATLIHADCMDILRSLSDGEYDLAIVDPPYQVKMAGGKSPDNGFKSQASWDKMRLGWDTQRPSADYFNELRRVATNQIIWGANYYPEHLSPSMGWIFWYKMQDNFSFSDGEFAYTSFHKKSRIFKYARGVYSGACGNADSFRNIHPTQKPVKLYEWLLTTYAKPGQRILDTHLGSGSSAIAANNLGFTFTGIEIDADYFQAAKERIEQAHRQEKLF